MIVGLTGSSGSGKSEIAKVFAENGFTVIDADEISRDVQSKGTNCLEEIVFNFGEDILHSDGSLDRRKLGEIVFADGEKLKLLTKITHKYILKEIEKQAEDMGGDILIDAPLLFEANVNKKCDVCIGIISDRQKQIERICTRDGISEKTADARLKKQNDHKYYKDRCDYIIENNGALDEAKKSALNIIAKLKER